MATTYDDLRFVAYRPKSAADFGPVIVLDETDDMDEEEWGRTVQGMVDGGCEVLDADAYADLLLEDVPEGAVIFEYCPRGFANEVSYHWADSLPDVDGAAEISRDELRRQIARGGHNYASDKEAGVCWHTNPPCGDWRLTAWGV